MGEVAAAGESGGREKVTREPDEALGAGAGCAPVPEARRGCRREAGRVPPCEKRPSGSAAPPAGGGGCAGGCEAAELRDVCVKVVEGLARLLWLAVR